MYPEFYDGLFDTNLNTYGLGATHSHVYDMDEDEYSEIEFKIPAWVKVMVSTVFVTFSAFSIIALSFMVA